MVARAAGQKHWTELLFVERPELFLPFLELAEERAPDETRALAELFGRFGVPPEGRVLDVACGIGRHAIPMARRGYRVTGIDLSPPYVEMARRRAGMAERSVSFCASVRSPVIAVMMKPGATQLAVIPLDATSLAMDLVIPASPALEAE